MPCPKIESLQVLNRFNLDTLILDNSEQAQGGSPAVQLEALAHKARHAVAAPPAASVDLRALAFKILKNKKHKVCAASPCLRKWLAVTSKPLAHGRGSSAYLVFLVLLNFKGQRTQIH